MKWSELYLCNMKCLFQDGFVPQSPYFYLQINICRVSILLSVKCYE